MRGCLSVPRFPLDACAIPAPIVSSVLPFRSPGSMPGTGGIVLSREYRRPTHPGTKHPGGGIQRRFNVCDDPPSPEGREWKRPPPATMWVNSIGTHDPLTPIQRRSGFGIPSPHPLVLVVPCCRPPCSPSANSEGPPVSNPISVILGE